MSKLSASAVVYFLEGEAPRLFPTLELAVNFLTQFCPEKLRSSAWIIYEGLIIEDPQIRAMAMPAPSGG